MLWQSLLPQHCGIAQAPTWIIFMDTVHGYRSHGHCPKPPYDFHRTISITWAGPCRAAWDGGLGGHSTDSTLPHCQSQPLPVKIRLDLIFHQSGHPWCWVGPRWLPSLRPTSRQACLRSHQACAQPCTINPPLFFSIHLLPISLNDLWTSNQPGRLQCRCTEE